LDITENAHILAMLRAAEIGHLVTIDELVFRQNASQIKFQCFHMGFLFLALDTPVKKGWVFLKWVFLAQMIAGLMIFMTTDQLRTMLYFFRAAFFIAGPLLIIGGIRKSGASEH